MLFPISDDDRELSGVAYVTWALLILNLVGFAIQYNNPTVTRGWSMVPREIMTGVDLVEAVEVPVGQEAGLLGRQEMISIPQAPGPPFIFLTILTSMFLHGGLSHIGGNMLYLWIFGDNVEHRFGHLPFLIFYLLSGGIAAVAQVAMDGDSVVPTLGASGAIAGVMGAYLVLFPRNKVNAVFIFRIVSIPAILVLGLWVGMQVFQVMQSGEGIGGVAYAAHIGGFVAGVAIAGFYRFFLISGEPESILRKNYDRDPTAERVW